MADVRSYKRPLVLAGVLIAAIFSNASVWALSLPGIPDSGLPAFGNSVKVQLNPNSGTLKVLGRQSFLFNDGTSVWQGGAGQYTLLANFDSSGNLLSGGTVSLRGRIDGLGINSSSLLMSADLTSWVWGNEDGSSGPTFDLLGFGTDNIICNPDLLVQCTQRESVFVQLDRPFNGDFNSGVYLTTGFATTTIPIPASMWLFGSGLALLFFVRRKLAFRTIESPSSGTMPG